MNLLYGARELKERRKSKPDPWFMIRDKSEGPRKRTTHSLGPRLTSHKTISHFLERFVNKNPTKPKASSSGVNGTDGDDDAELMASKGKGPSAMQPAASALEGVKLVKGDVGNDGRVVGLVNEKAFLRRGEDVPVDQLSFHRYFTKKAEKEKAMAAKLKKGKEGKDDELDSDEDEEEDSEDEEGMNKDEEADETDDEDNSELDENEVWKAMKASMPRVEGDDDDLLMGSDIDEDEDRPLDFDDDDNEDIQVDFSENDNADDDDDNNNDDEKDDSDADDVLSLVGGSDNEDLISLDGDVPDGLIEYDECDASDEEARVSVDEDGEWGGIDGGPSGKKRKGQETSGAKRKKLRSLPTFASYEDYAKMIEDGPEDEIYACTFS